MELVKKNGVSGIQQFLAQLSRFASNQLTLGRANSSSDLLLNVDKSCVDSRAAAYKARRNGDCDSSVLFALQPILTKSEMEILKTEICRALSKRTWGQKSQRTPEEHPSKWKMKIRRLQERETIFTPPCLHQSRQRVIFVFLSEMEVLINHKIIFLF